MATRYRDMLSYDPEQERKAIEYIHQHRTWFIALGAALIVLGVIAALSSITTTFVSMFFLSAVSADRRRHPFRQRVQRARVVGIAAAGAGRRALCGGGRLDLQAPGRRRARLDASVCGLFMAVGLFRMITSIWHRFASWGWVALSGAVSFVLGLMLWNQWPVSGLWFIGLCIGIDLIVEGIGWLMLCYGADTAHAEQAQRPAAR